jgi:hypothetical protein
MDRATLHNDVTGHLSHGGLVVQLKIKLAGA